MIRPWKEMVEIAVRILNDTWESRRPPDGASRDTATVILAVNERLHDLETRLRRLEDR